MEDDDWEKINFEDLDIYKDQKERETKLLEERKLMEEADLALAIELFTGDLEQNNTLNNSEKVINSEK